jgi:phosphatidylglycerophosphatase A
LPLAPATFSCFISILIWYFFLPAKILYVAITAALFVIGIYVSDDLAKTWGKDPRRIVVDEYASMLIPLFFTPLRILPLVITFLLFRLFDIVKPPPIRHLEDLRGGWGIMLDDLLAAIYTTVIILILKTFANIY